MSSISLKNVFNSHLNIQILQGLPQFPRQQNLLDQTIISLTYLRFDILKQMKPHKTVTKIRRDLRSLSDYQLNYYLLLSKLLRIFAPDITEINVENYKFRAYVSANLIQYVEVTPTCYYDILISHHCTCCQHGNQFFPYWHRWLLSQFQKFLEKVDTKISQLDPTLIKVQAERLQAIASTNTISPIPTIQEIQALLTGIKIIYDKIPPEAKTNIAAHYWNLFDNTQPIYYAKGFSQPRSYLSTVDSLIKLIWGEDGFFQFNFKTRWYGNRIDQALDYTNGYLKTNNFQSLPTDEQIKQLIQNEAFWQNPDGYNNNNLASQAAFLFSNNSGEINYFYQKSNKIQLSSLISQYKITHNVFQAQDINLLFGGVGKSFYDTRDQGTIGYMRNQYLAYYQYAEALRTDPIKFMNYFCTTAINRSTSMQNPHNFMHNYQISMMSDSNFSIINPIFFPYHSFIDLMLQIKIQWINHGFRPWLSLEPFPDDIRDGYDSGKSFLNSQFQPQGMRSQFKSQWKLYMDSLTNQTVQNKDYPILSYINPNWNNSTDITKQFIPVTNYTFSDLILDQVNFRLKDLSSTSASYDIQYTNPKDKLINQLIEVIKVLPVIKEQRLSVCVQVKYQSTIKSGNFLVAIRNSNNKIIDYVPVGIFSKGLAAKSCPNCPKYHVDSISIPISKFQDKKELISISKLGGMKASKSNLSEVNIFPQFNAQSNLYPSSKNPQVSLRIKTGRRIVTVIIGKSQKKGAIILSFIGQAQDYHDKDNQVRSFISQYHEYPVKSLNDVYVRYENKGKVVTQVQGSYIIGDKSIPFKYKFPLHSDNTELRIDVDILSQINQKSTQTERVKSLIQNPKGYLHPSKEAKLRKKIQEYKFMDEEDEEEKQLKGKHHHAMKQRQRRRTTQ